MPLGFEHLRPGRLSLLFSGSREPGLDVRQAKKSGGIFAYALIPAVSTCF